MSTDALKKLEQLRELAREGNARALASELADLLGLEMITFVAASGPVILHGGWSTPAARPMAERLGTVQERALVQDLGARLLRQNGEPS